MHVPWCALTSWLHTWQVMWQYASKKGSQKVLRVFSPHFGKASLRSYTETLEKNEQIHWRKFKKSNGEVSPCLANPAGLVQVSKQPKCPEVLTESAKGVFEPPEWVSQNNLLQGAKPCFGLVPPMQNTGCAVRETLLGLPAQRHQITFSTLLKYFWEFCCFDTR